MSDATPPPPRDDADVRRFLDELGVPGIADVHVHFLPEPVQRKVWAKFDELGDWPITYRTPEEDRLAHLRDLGVRVHTALAYAHRPGMAAWLNEHTLSLAERHDQVVPTFTIYPEDAVDGYVAGALARGGRVVKVHLQVGKFSATDPKLDAVWRELERRGLPIVLHAGAVADGSGGEQWCGIEPVHRLLEAHPELRLVIAHAGAPDFRDFLLLAEGTPTVRLDTAVVMVDPEFLGRYPPDLVDRFGALGEQVVFGSDFPSIPHTFAAQVRGLATRGFGAAWLRDVLWRTPARLLGLSF